MKKIIFTLAFLTSFFGFSQSKNSLLERNFWNKNTTIEAVKTEIEKGNSPSELNHFAFDPVSLAINNDAPLNTILYLLEQEGNQVDKPTHDGRTYLHWAASKGNIPLITHLLSKGFSPFVKDTKRMTPLSYAAILGQTNPDVYALFFNAGVNPKETNANGENLLHLTIANDTHLTLSEYLISKGLSLSDTDKYGYTVFDHACKKGNISLLKKLREKGIGYTSQSLLFAAQGARRFANTFDVFKYLVTDLKINPSSVNKENQNVLHFIVSKENQHEIIKFFLNKKVSVNQPDKEGNTPFINAGSNKDTSVLQLLMPLIKNINQKNKKGETALSNAVLFGSAKNIQLLIDKGANVKIKNTKGNTLAYFLIDKFQPQNEKEFDEKLSILKANKVDFAQKQAQGNTLYHLAVIKNNLKLLEKLNDLGININHKNDAGETPLIKAVLLAKDTQILTYLINNGADKTITTEFGETVYDIAQENEALKSKNISVEFLK